MANIDIGNRIFENVDKAPRELVEQFRGIPSSNIGDMMNRLYCMRYCISRIGNTDKPLLGTALTVHVPDGDNAFIHRALDLAQPGDVLVIDGNGCLSRALMGEIMFTYAQNIGIAGIVIDGAVRDSDSLHHLDIPVYAAAVTPQGPYKNGPGEINVPVSCGGQVVFPGDVLVGDADGVCVIRREDAGTVLEAARAKFDSESKLLNEYHTCGNNEKAHRETYLALTEQIKTAVYNKAYNG